MMVYIKMDFREKKLIWILTFVGTENGSPQTKIDPLVGLEDFMIS